MSFADFPIEVVENILRRIFVKNSEAIKLEIVCKSFKEAMDKYYDRTKLEDFVCKSCYEKSYSTVEVIKCKNCPFNKFSHDSNCKTKQLRLGGGYNIVNFKKCFSCQEFCDKHKLECENGKLKVRGICGFCIGCLSYKLNKRECVDCGLEFMTIFEGKNAYCLSCLPKAKPKIKINPEWKEVLLTDEPSCY